MNDAQYFFLFYEVETPAKVLNLGATVANAMHDDAGIGPSFEDSYGSRKGHWYIAIEVYSNQEKDCLHIDTLSREPVLEYLRTLKQEYLTTHNYHETVFKN